MFVCDWCGERIEGKRGMVTMTIAGMFADTSGLDGYIKDERRHFHVGRDMGPGNDEDSCLLRALHLIDGHGGAVETLERIPTATDSKIVRLRAKHQRQEGD